MERVFQIKAVFYINLKQGRFNKIAFLGVNKYINNSK